MHNKTSNYQRTPVMDNSSSVSNSLAGRPFLLIKISAYRRIGMGVLAQLWVNIIILWSRTNRKRQSM
jgi:hypothetical protein